MGSLLGAKKPPPAPEPKPIDIPAPEPPPTPAPTRMPVIADANEQARIAREKAFRRRGRLSTILTDVNTTGSSGRSLGA